MNAAELRNTLVEALGRLESCRDELRSLDAAIGDGDLGITVGDGARAAVQALESEAPDTVAGQLRCVAKSFANANPSTMSGLVAGALLAGAREVGETTEIDAIRGRRLLMAATSAIMSRGGAMVGDKTMVDPMAASLDAFNSDASPPEIFTAMITAAARAVDETAKQPSKKGRAAWVGERSIGHADGGATAYLRLLQALEASWPRR